MHPPAYHQWLRGGGLVTCFLVSQDSRFPTLQKTESPLHARHEASGRNSVLEAGKMLLASGPGSAGNVSGYTAERQAPPPRSASRGPAHFAAPGQQKQWVLTSVSSPLSTQKRVRVCNQAARTPGWVPNSPCGLVSDRMSAST